MLTMLYRLLFNYLVKTGLVLCLSPAQGIYKQTTVAKQTALGTPKVGAGGQILRRKTAVFNRTVDTTPNDEIVSHRQDTGITYGSKKTGGKVDGNLSPGTYALLQAAALMDDFSAVTPMVIGTDLTSAAVGLLGVGTFADASAGYLAAGLKVGMVGRFTGFAVTTTDATANNGRNFWITALTAGLMTGRFLDGTVPIAKVEAASVTFTVVGKISTVPVTGQTNDFLTFEEWYSDKTLSEVYPDCKVNQLQFGIPAAGPATFSADIVGLGTRTRAGSQSFTTPAVETSTGVLQAALGAIYVNGAIALHITSLSMTVDRGITPIGASIGDSVSPDFNQGRIKLSGTFTGMFDDAVLQGYFDNQTAVGLCVVACSDTTPTSDFVAIMAPRIKITSDTADDGEKAISRTYAFTAEYNGVGGGAALANDVGIISIQDSAAP